MSEIKADALRKQIKNSALDRCYLFYGKEHYLQEHYSRELRKAVLGGEDDPFNLRQLDGKNLDPQALADAVDAADADETPYSATVACGVSIGPVLKELLDLAGKKWHNARWKVCPIVNEFFGERITVSGLITGQDLVAFS